MNHSRVPISKSLGLILNNDYINMKAADGDSGREELNHSVNSFLAYGRR